MAGISITVGPLTAQRTFADDAKVSATLLKYYEHYDLMPLGDMGLSNQEKLELIVDSLVLYIIEKVRAAELAERQQDIQQIEQDIAAEFDFREAS